MTVFVSYVRAENPTATLDEIAAMVAAYGAPYIDEIHHHRYSGDRTKTVVSMLNSADSLVAVVSPNYLKTPWTRWEFQVAHNRGIPMFALLPGGSFMALEPGQASILGLVQKTLADDTSTTNATKLLASASKAISRVVLSIGVMLAGLAALLVFGGVGALTGSALVAGSAGATAAGRVLWRRHSAKQKEKTTNGLPPGE